MFERFYEIVKQIPKGKVMNYGAVARLAGFPGRARQVGWALSVNPDPDSIPCHRVLFKDGRLSPAFAFGGINAQRHLLESEGVEINGDRVDMAKYSVSAD